MIQLALYFHNYENDARFGWKTIICELISWRHSDFVILRSPVYFYDISIIQNIIHIFIVDDFKKKKSQKRFFNVSVETRYILIIFLLFK